MTKELASVSESALQTTDERIRSPLAVRARPYLITLPALLILVGILIPFFIGIYISLTSYALNRPGSFEELSSPGGSSMPQTVPCCWYSFQPDPAR